MGPSTGLAEAVTRQTQHQEPKQPQQQHGRVGRTPNGTTQNKLQQQPQNAPERRRPSYAKAVKDSEAQSDKDCAARNQTESLKAASGSNGTGSSAGKGKNAKKGNGAAPPAAMVLQKKWQPKTRVSMAESTQLQPIPEQQQGFSNQNDTAPAVGEGGDV